MALGIHARAKPAGTAARRGLSWATISLLFVLPLLARAQAPPETIGHMEGDDVSAKGQISVTYENNRSTMILASGSEVTVRSGQARVTLVEGGEIDICGPAHFTLLKSGGAITVALDFGRLRVALSNGVPLTVYTPLVVATPLAIAGGPRQIGFGVESTGSICVLAATGAVRLDEQFTGQSIVVPQGSEMVLPTGQLDSIRPIPGSCRCEMLVAKTNPLPASQPPEYSVPAKPNARVPTTTAANQPEPKLAEPGAQPAATPRVSAEKAPLPGPPATQLPTWKVVMPPLVFDASAPEPPLEPNPEMILLIRQVRDQPEMVFSGRVEAPPKNQHRKQPSAGLTGRRAQVRRKSGVFARVLAILTFRWLGFGHRSPRQPPA